jgi:hypothetical protein
MRRAVLGFVVGLVTLLAAGEAVLRLYPPSDLHRFLGESAPLSGPFRPDAEMGVAYRGWEALEADYRERLESYRPWLRPRPPSPCWAMFGNSFVQAPGMLADTARRRLTGVCIVNLARNEELPVRIAGAAELLDAGLRPERIFVVLLPLDLSGLRRFPLSEHVVTASGALTYRPRLPGGAAGAVLGGLRLGLMAWVRAGLHQADPAFRPQRLNLDLPPGAAADVERLIGALTRKAGDVGVPVTVVLIPSHEQITRGVPCGVQDALRPVLERAGADVCDVREAFLAAEDKPSLFIPDKHFSDRGNDLLLNAILRHVRRDSAIARRAAP